MGGKFPHSVERILGVTRGIIWHDRDCPDADFAQGLCFGHDAADAGLHIRAMIANEDDKRAFRAAHVNERIGVAVNSLKGKILCLPANRVFGVDTEVLPLRQVEVISHAKQLLYPATWCEKEGKVDKSSERAAIRNCRDFWQPKIFQNGLRGPQGFILKRQLTY